MAACFASYIAIFGTVKILKGHPAPKTAPLVSAAPVMVSGGDSSDLVATRGFPKLTAENMEQIFSNPTMAANFEKWVDNPGSIALNSHSLISFQ